MQSYEGTLLYNPLGLMKREYRKPPIPKYQLFFQSIEAQTDEKRYGMPTVDPTETRGHRTVLTSHLLVLHASESSTQAKPSS